MNILISVVIPTYQRPQSLWRCLEALAVQDLGDATCEILVVDDARSPITREQAVVFAGSHGVGHCGSHLHLRYLQPPPGKRGPAAARNAGWRAARGEIIAFTDDDSIPAPDWLSRGLAAMQPGFAAAWGHVEVPLPPAPSDAERNTTGLHGAEFVTANCFVRRAALFQVDGFDERFKRPWREDSDLYFTLLERGHQVVAAPDAIVVHPARQSPVLQCLRRHRNLFFDALLYKKHPQLYRSKIAAAPPWYYYLTVFFGVLALLAFAAGWGGLTTLATAAWLGLTLHLAHHRQQGLRQTGCEMAGILFTSVLIPPLAVFWRLAGAWHFRVVFA